MTDIQKNIEKVRAEIAHYAKKYGREENSIHLLAVSKGQSIEKIKKAMNANQYHFGESYLQEALEKISALEEEKTLIWHFIGPIQRNKTRKIAEHFAWVHSVSDLNIAKRLDEQRPTYLPPINICIQVNISRETTKSGIFAEDVPTFLHACLPFSRLRIRGLMCIPARDENIHEARKAFHQLFLLWQSLRKVDLPLDTLSMGMSFDFEAAIAEGSTIVRIGTEIFGKRDE
jgi:pyridoxal phosphate enzyme (YggS family)